VLVFDKELWVKDMGFKNDASLIWPSLANGKPVREFGFSEQSTCEAYGRKYLVLRSWCREVPDAKSPAPVAADAEQA
jgi:hypothetical protein